LVETPLDNPIPLLTSPLKGEEIAKFCIVGKKLVNSSSMGEIKMEKGVTRKL